MRRKIIGYVIALLTISAIAVPKVLSVLHAEPGSVRSGRPTSGSHGVRAAVFSALPVQAIVLRPTPFADGITATGTLRADEGVELQAEISGKIIAVQIREGTRVRQGDLLVKINDADTQATLQRATARRSLAEIRERRVAGLLAQGGSNQQDYDAALSELHVQQAEVRLIEAQIAKTEIRAPFDGVIGLRFVSEGSYVSPTSRIATLQKLESVKIDFTVPERYANRVRAGRPVHFTVAGNPQAFIGEVYAAEPRVDATTRTVLVRAVFDNTKAGLLPGAFANVEFALDRLDDALMVPQVAVIAGLTEKNVFVVEDGKAVRRNVRTGARTADAIQVVEGLTAGDQVIVSGLEGLRNGSPVRLITPDS